MATRERWMAARERKKPAGQATRPLGNAGQPLGKTQNAAGTQKSRRDRENGGREEKAGAGEAPGGRGFFENRSPSGERYGGPFSWRVVLRGEAEPAIQPLYIPKNFSAFSSAATIQAVKLASRLICVAVRSVSKVL